jgi:hypothetical protein
MSRIHTSVLSHRITIKQYSYEDGAEEWVMGFYPQGGLVRVASSATQGLARIGLLKRIKSGLGTFRWPEVVDDE